MPRRGSIEAHPERGAIDEALLAGESHRAIAGRFDGVSRSALQRYAAGTETAPDSSLAAPGTAPEAPDGAQAPPGAADGAGAQDTSGAGAGPAAPEKPTPAELGSTPPRARAADPATAPRYRGATEPISGYRAVLFVNGHGPPALVLRLPAGRWPDDAVAVGRAVLEHECRRRGTDPAAVAAYLPAVTFPSTNPALVARAKVDGMARRLVGAVGLGAPNWEALAAELGDVAALHAAIDGAEREAAERDEAQRVAEIRREPAAIRLHLARTTTDVQNHEAAAVRHRALADGHARSAEAARERLDDLVVQLAEAEAAVADLAPVAPDPQPAPDPQRAAELAGMAKRNAALAKRNADRAARMGAA